MKLKREHPFYKINHVKEGITRLTQLREVHIIGDREVVTFVSSLTDKQRMQLYGEVVEIAGKVIDPWETIVTNLGGSFDALLMRLSAISAFRDQLAEKKE